MALLRHPAYVNYSERRSWVVWLRCVAGIVTTSHDFRDARYRRLDLLDALDNLMAEGIGMGIEQAGLCAGKNTFKRDLSIAGHVYTLD